MTTVSNVPRRERALIDRPQRPFSPTATTGVLLWGVLHLTLSVLYLVGVGPGSWEPVETSLLAPLSTSAVAMLVAGLALAALVTLALIPRTGRPTRLAGAVLLTVGVAVVLVVADVRSLTLLGYLPMVLLWAVGVDPFASQDLSVPVPAMLSLSHSIGGFALVLTGLHALTSLAGPMTREAAAGRRAAALRAGRLGVGVAVTVPVLYAATRVAWALGIPLGVSDEFLVELGDAKYAGLGLGLFAVVGSLLTLGLVQRWGEVFWAWLPGIGGRRVPVSMAFVPALFVAAAVTSAGLGFARIVLGPQIDRLPGDPADWGTWGPELLWIPWGIALAVAAFAYRMRREAVR